MNDHAFAIHVLEFKILDNAAMILHAITNKADECDVLLFKSQNEQLRKTLDFLKEQE